MDSKVKTQPMRPFGQCSITSSFIFRQSNRRENRVKEPKDAISIHANQQTSLSEFLDRKLKRCNESSKVVKRKLTPFSTPYAVVEDVMPTDSNSKIEDQTVFEQFKHVNEEKEFQSDSLSLHQTTNEITSTDRNLCLEGTRKQKNSLEGRNQETSLPKPLLVLGNNESTRFKRSGDFTDSKKKLKRVYNHYENGSGWWDCDREGVDAEEVGFREVWEGVGSTTFGSVLDWHRQNES